MARINRDLFAALGLCLSLVCVSVEQPRNQRAVRRLYALQPGPGPGSAGADGASHLGSVSTGQAHTYNVEVSANFRSRKVRSRRMGNPAQNQQEGAEQKHQLSGVNVCGGQCCHGWSEAQGSHRCTKPNCFPQCQNGGICLRPQLCVCKPGSKGTACEQKMVPTHSFPFLPGTGPTNGLSTRLTNGHTNGHSNGQNTNGHSVVPQRPIPQQMPPSGYASAPPPPNNMAQMKLTVKQPAPLVRPYYIQQHIQQQVRSLHPAQSQQYITKPKYYHKYSPAQPERPIPLTVGHNPLLSLGNHTGRIKVIFTPTICKFTCIGGRCHNNCELGNTTTIISENGRAADTLTAPNFRVVVCHLPCMNGGKCSARDKCQCPSNFTGKFCQMPVHHRHQQQHQQEAGGYSQTQVHSTQTLPLTYSNGHSTVFSPSIVNIHIKHPPEASVQVHQVSQLDNYHKNRHQHKGFQSGSSLSTSYTHHHMESSQKIQHHGYNIVYPSQHGYGVPQHQPVTSNNMLGRCFQETAGSQCGKALPGLTKQEQCCANIGTSWGFHKCLKCPKKQSVPLINCPQGYNRINSSHCQDLDECQLHGVCVNGNCLNTVGSFQCICKAGYILDPTFTTCISNTPVVPEEKAACFRLVSSGRQCLHPVSAQLSKQLCCCSVGKAWGPQCDKCPPPGTATFKEICPGGMGYTVLPNPPINKPVIISQEPTELLTPQPLPVPEKPVEAFGKPEIIPEVIERSSPPAPVEILPSNAGQDIAPTQSAEVDECQIYPHICGRGICYNTAEGYTCHCDEGYRLDDAQATCVDVDECLERPSLCLGGHCENTEGDFLCVCPRGFLLSEQRTSCVDIDECVNRSLCPSGICINVPGGYNCGTCPHGFLGQGGHCVDVDECEDQQLCTRGHCSNTQGSFVCECGPGFRLSSTRRQCDDVDECVDEPRPCQTVGECVNNMGSYTCTCPLGYRQVNGTTCRDVDECVEDAELCSPHGECVNTEGSYTCMCDSGFIASLDTPSCDDIDECGLDDKLCGPHGFCENRLGSFRCLCDQGYQESQAGQACVDVNECELLSRVCGDAQCVNVDGSFTCVCPSGHSYDVMTAKCVPVPTASAVERKECYHHLNHENLCESVLTSHVTLQECCCTLGAGWGDNCEVYPCPVNGTDHFNQMCPSGRGFVPGGEVPYGEAAADSYKDADECALFGQEVCKGGFCLDTLGSYECYCKTGQDYDHVRMECRDIDECLDETVCTGGQCLNTDGSYSCFCTYPMELDLSGNHCVLPELSEPHEQDQSAHHGICWQVVTDTMTCTQPLRLNRETTYTECCCLFGQAWGMDCALCPRRNTENYVNMCNLPLGAGRRPYGHDSLVASPILEYEVTPDYPPSPEQQAVLPFYEDLEQPYEAFEGLRAEECGILDGCENGRCVRIQDGYTCQCFSGYTLDRSSMACVDVNECLEANGRVSPCHNARCVNTAGSYRCKCLPGFAVSERPHSCVEAADQPALPRPQQA